MEEYVHKAAELGQGKVMNNSHPIHPSTVHWPVALLTTSFAIDGLDLVSRKGLIPSSISSMLPPMSGLRVTSHYMCSIGTVMAGISVVTGLAELYEMWRVNALNKGNKETAKETLKGDNEKLWTTIRHASVNDIGIIISAYNWYTRHRAVTSNALPINNLWLSLVGLGAIMYGGYLGGHLTYALGVGVQRQGSAAEKSD